MKKTIALLAVIFLCGCSSFLPFLTPTFSAHADGDYMRVITTDTPVFEDRSMTKLLFNLPYTYYVRVLSVEGETAHIEYAGNRAPAIDGFVKYAALYSDGLSVENPYPAVTVRTAKTAVLYSDVSLSENARYIFPERELYYYGNIPSGESFVYCVSYNGNLGYVKEDCLYPFSVPDHPNELTFIKTETQAEPTFNEIAEEKKTDDSFVLRIIVIGCLIFAGIVAAFAVKRPKKTDYSDYDENDFG